MQPVENLKRGVAYFTIGVTFVTALAAASKVKAAISGSPAIAALGTELAKGVGMLGSFVVYLVLIGLCTLVVYPVLKNQSKAENHEPKRKPVLSQQTPVPR